MTAFEGPPARATAPPPAPPPSRLLVVPGPRLARSDVPRLCERLTELLDGTGDGTGRGTGDRTRDGTGPAVAEVVCDMGALTRPDLAAVEAVARLRLTAKRAGVRLTFRGVGPDLGALLALTGLGP